MPALVRSCPPHTSRTPPPVQPPAAHKPQPTARAICRVSIPLPIKSSILKPRSRRCSATNHQNSLLSPPDRIVNTSPAAGNEALDMKGLSITSRARERLVVAHQAPEDSPRLPRTRLSASSGKPIDRNSDAGGGNGKRGGPLSRWSLLPQSACARWAVALAGAALLVAALLLLLRADRIFTDVGGGTTEACCFWDRCSGQLCSTAAAVALRRRKRRCAHVGQLSFAAAQKNAPVAAAPHTRSNQTPFYPHR